MKKAIEVKAQAINMPHQIYIVEQMKEVIMAVGESVARIFAGKYTTLIDVVSFSVTKHYRGCSLWSPRWIGGSKFHSVPHQKRLCPQLVLERMHRSRATTGTNVCQ